MYSMMFLPAFPRMMRILKNKNKVQIELDLPPPKKKHIPCVQKTEISNQTSPSASTQKTEPTKHHPADYTASSSLEPAVSDHLSPYDETHAYAASNTSSKTLENDEAPS